MAQTYPPVDAYMNISAESSADVTIVANKAEPISYPHGTDTANSSYNTVAISPVMEIGEKGA